MKVDNIQIGEKYDEAYRLYRMASDAMLAGNSEAAVTLFEQSNRLQPHFKTCLELGKCLAGLGRHLDAIVPLAAATALNRQGIAPFELAKAYMKLNEPGKANEFIKLAIERQPDLKCARELEPVIRDAAEKRAHSLGSD